jgi:hypothetical protein
MAPPGWGGWDRARRAPRSRERLAAGMKSPKAFGPRDVIRSDGRFGLAIALAVLLAAGLLYGLLYGLAAAFVVGLTFAANVWSRYNVSVVIIAIRKQGPLRFGAFLDLAQEAGLLRVSGITYQFRHRQLQDWPTSP